MPSTAALSKKSMGKRAAPVATKKSAATRSASVAIKKNHGANRRRDPSSEASPPPELPTDPPQPEMPKKAAPRRLTANLRGAQSLRPTRPSPAVRTATPEPATTPGAREEGDGDAASPAKGLPPAAGASPARSPSPRGRGSSRRPSTPPAAPSPDSGLYGLSPGGEQSRARIEERQQREMSRRESLAQPQSALKAQGTPALETSILALGRFRRRKRQPSVIRLVQLEAEAAAAAADSELDLDLDLDMDDFNPEDESTPLHLTSTRLVTDGSSGSRKRKRDVSDEEPVMPSSPPVARPSKLVILSGDESSELSSVGLSEDDSLPRAQFEPLRPEDQDPMSETNAPPLSTSPEPSPQPVQKEVAHPRRGARRGPEYLLTETLTSLLPRNPHRPLLAELDTAESSSQRASDLDSSGLGSSAATEIPSSPPRPAPRRATRAAARATTRAAASAAPKAKKPKAAAPPPAEAPSRTLPRGKTRARPPLGERRDAINGPVHKRGAAASKARKRTFGGRRGAAEGKENEGDGTFRLADSSDSVEAPVVGRAKGKGSSKGMAPAAVPKKQSEEMERLKKKFAEVDAWEMDFESVDMGGTSSSWR
jgi:hypothetical protein